jgi:hypothetical protein
MVDGEVKKQGAESQERAEKGESGVESGRRRSAAVARWLFV